MANETPVLLLGYNRPHQMRGLIESLAPLKPKLILFAVDGPRNNRANDAELVRQTQELASEITWDAEICTRFRDSNLGLRRAVVDAVTWANGEYGRVIVLEDDVRAGPQLLDFLNYNLNAHQESAKIAHINGYNLVPREHLMHPDQASRLSIYPESYAWATWERAWQKYDDDLTWAKNVLLRDLEKICGSKIGALKWKQNFADAAAERIDTWAYRWLASMWKHGWRVVSPNRNLATYDGGNNGTHTRSRPNWVQPLIEPISEIACLQKFEESDKDIAADMWLSNNVYFESIFGLAKGGAVSFFLNLIQVREKL